MVETSRKIQRILPRKPRWTPGCLLLLGLSTLLPSVSCQRALPTAVSKQLLAATSSEAPAAVHGMVLFGTETLYASHIPMFQSPHDWQALMKVELSHPSVDAVALYLSQIGGGTQPLITLQPQPFVLTRVLSGRETSFTADLYRGDFEDGGELLLSGIQVKVSAVLYQQRLRRQTASLAALTYLVAPLGEGSAALIHKISAPDNFDQVVQTSMPLGSAGAPGALQTLVVQNASDSSDQRLTAGQSLSLTPSASGWTATRLARPSGPSGAAATVTADFYCSPGPDFYGPCGR